MLDDEIDNKIMKLLETYAKHEPNPVNPPITINDIKDYMNSPMNMRRLIEDQSYHAPGRKPFMHLRRLKRSQ